MRVHTKSESYYDIKDGFWSKNGGEVSKIWDMKTLPVEPWVNTWAEVWPLLAERPTVDHPVVGERLFVSGRDNWWLSTEVVGIDDDDATSN